VLFEYLGQVVVGEGEAVGESGDSVEGEESRQILEDDCGLSFGVEGLEVG
jgi:hypothetical protein